MSCTDLFAEFPSQRLFVLNFGGEAGLLLFLALLRLAQLSDGALERLEVIMYKMINTESLAILWGKYKFNEVWWPPIQ